MPWVLTGLLYATWVQSLWNWRPQISITGASHSGKTTMLEFIATCFGKHLVKGAKLTEAAIRQSLGNSSKAIMIDEFEADNNRRKTMELVRVAGGGGEIHRGTASGKVRSFGLAHIFWFAAIELGLNDEADKNRFIEIVLERPPQRASRLDLPPIAEMEEIRTWIMATAIYYGKKCREIVADLKFHSIPGVDIRMVEQYAVPAAFISVLANEFDDKNPKYSPEFFLEQFVLPRTEMIRAVADEKSLIDEILGSVVRTGGGDEKTVGQVMSVYYDDVSRTDGQNIASQGSCLETLEKVGIEMSMTWNDSSKRNGFVFIWRTAVERHLLQNTRWKDKNINHILRNIDQAYEERFRISGSRHRGIFVPVEVFGFDDPDDD